jgi:hypothetical protein
VKGRRTALALVLAAAAVAAGLPAGAQFSVPRVLVAVASASVTALPETATSVVAQCGSGTPLVGGGMLAAKADPANPVLASTGLRAKSSHPSDGSGGPAPDGTADPVAWTTTAAFGAETEAGDRIFSLALCTTLPVGPRVVVSRSVNGPTASATQAQVTVTCPADTVLVGGGGDTAPGGSGSLKPVGMYPSDAAGAMLADGTVGPTSWTVVGATENRGAFANVTTAFAMCAALPGHAVRVARLDAPGPRAANSSTTTAVSCGETPDALIGGGVLTDNSLGDLQFGVHLRGSYPSDMNGAPAVAGTADPAAWSAVVSSGGVPAPNTDVHVFGLCAGEITPPAPV